MNQFCLQNSDEWRSRLWCRWDFQWRIQQHLWNAFLSDCCCPSFHQGEFLSLRFSDSLLARQFATPVLLECFWKSHGEFSSPDRRSYVLLQPDIASFSEDVDVMYEGSLTGVGGTSCAAPVVSAIISLINDQRLQAGKKTLGFLNPALYQLLAKHPDAFFGLLLLHSDSLCLSDRLCFADITSGSNPDGCCPGFYATTGWDAVWSFYLPGANSLHLQVTGVGAPNFATLSKYLGSLWSHL